MDYGSGSEDFILQKVSAEQWGGDAGEGEGVPVNTLAFGQACVHSIPQTLRSFHVTIELDVGVRDSEVEQCPQVFTTSKR